MKQKVKDIHFRVYEHGLYMRIIKRIMKQFGYSQHAKAIKHCIVNFLKNKGNGFVIIEDIKAKCAFIDDNHINLNEIQQFNKEGEKNE